VGFAIRRWCLAGSLCAFAALLNGTIPVLADIVWDDFRGDELSPTMWFVCKRDENEFRIENVPGKPFRAVRALVHPRSDLGLVTLLFRHRECRYDDEPYIRGRVERAEIWEADRIRLSYGTEVWYQFVMLVDPSISRASRHLVIGQWKQSGGNSPFVAQRFDRRIFTISIEQDNRSSGGRLAQTQCRVIVATSESMMADLGRSFAHGPAPRDASRSGRGALSLVQDELHEPRDAGAPVRSSTPGCTSDLQIASFKRLPDPFGQWVWMRYRIRASSERNGLLEVWANGDLITRVEGRIGFDPRGAALLQYFKFGPYREHEPRRSYAMLAHFVRITAEGPLALRALAMPTTIIDTRR
jgi:hypothetical protein